MHALAEKKLANLLFVDDEPRVLNSMRATFRREYNVFVADSGARALELLESHDFDVIVSDQRMPSMTGVEVLKEVKRRAPRAMRILLTGYADLTAIEASINESEVFRYLMKPCPVLELREAVALAVEAANGGASQTSPTIEPVEQPHAPTPARVASVTGFPTRNNARTNGRVPVRNTGAHAASERRPVRVHDVPAPSKALTREDRVELLVLSRDAELRGALKGALDGSRVMHAAESMEQSIGLLESHSIGVLLTDAAVDDKALRELTAELKRHVPELVTIVVSQRSDAQMLIELINYGQIFRFLLKPFHAGQCRIWIDSAVRKHLELMDNPTSVVRHRVAAAPTPPPTGSLLNLLLTRMRQIKQRFMHVEQVQS